MSRSILRDKIAEFPNSLKSEETEKKKRLLIVSCLSILFAFFLIAYLMVWLSGDFDDSQYKDTYRVLVSGGLVLSYYALNNNRRRNMIIGCYNDDGTPIEQVNLSEKGRVYELEVCIVRHPRRYPEYKVDYSSMAFCSSKESAEQIKDEILQSGENWLKDIYCWYIYERVLDVNYDRSEYMACWLYNEKGVMIDKRLFPSYWSENGFIGRSEDEIRFKFGDLVELYDGDTVRLAYVLASPRKKEWYIKKTEENGEPYVGDISDDTYTIIVRVGKGQFVDYMVNHEHVDALSLFHPHYLIPKNISKYWKTFWELYEEDRRECYGDNPLPGQI